MDKKRKELIQMLDHLEEYAGNTGLSTRIMDNIQECKVDARRTDVDEERLREEIDDLFKSIEKKNGSGKGENTASEKEEVLADIKNKLGQMVNKYYQENENAVEKMSERKNLMMQKCYHQMKEIAWTDAYVRQINNEANYMNFFETTASEYEKDVSLFISDTLTNIKVNYSHMMDHIRNLLKSMGAFQHGIIDAKELYELDEQGDSAGKDIQAKIEMEGAGKKQIISFAQKTLPKVKRIAKKEKAKKNMAVLFPWLLIALLFARNVITQVMEKEQSTTKKSFVEQLDNLKKVLNFTQEFIKLPTMLVVLTAILVLLVVIYVIYVKLMQKHFAKSACGKSAAYLKKELIGFEQSKCLETTLDAVIKEAVEKQEQQYASLLNKAFGNFVEENDAEGNGLARIAEEWKRIRA